MARAGRARGAASAPESLRHDRSVFDKGDHKRQLHAWTINDELRMRGSCALPFA